MPNRVYHAEAHLERLAIFVAIMGARACAEG